MINESICKICKNYSRIKFCSWIDYRMFSIWDCDLLRKKNSTINIFSKYPDFCHYKLEHLINNNICTNIIRFAFYLIVDLLIGIPLAIICFISDIIEFVDS